jgi:hypothetical protein
MVERLCAKQTEALNAKVQADQAELKASQEKTNIKIEAAQVELKAIQDRRKLDI